MFTKRARYKSKAKYLNTFLILLFLLSQTIFAGTTGKISGIITDETGEPMPGVNVMIVGTTMGAASDINGEYFILNIPPGTYSIRATMVGYKPYVVDQVKVITDFTTNINFPMPVATLLLDEEVIVVAERALVQKDQTSKIAIVDSEKYLYYHLQNPSSKKRY